MQIKAMLYTTVQPVRMAKIRHLTIPSSSEYGVHLGRSYITVVKGAWYSHFGKQLGRSFYFKHTFTIQSISATSRYLHKGHENLCSHKNFYANLYSSFIHNHHILIASEMSLNGKWINKLLHAYNGMLPCNKKK